MSTSSQAEWDELARWWLGEVDTDPMYRDEVYPQVYRLLGDVAGTVLDAGCGEGQGMRLYDGEVIGCDQANTLLSRARSAGPVVQARLPDLSWVRSDAFAAAYSVFVIDLVPDAAGLFAEVGRVVRPGGVFVVLVNHPVFTAPGAGPFLDDDGETLWRWGEYFEEGTQREPAGDGVVTFYHRSMSRLLSVAANAGWVLEMMEERGVSPAVVGRHPGYAGQEPIPRTLAVRWRRGLDSRSDGSLPMQ